MYPLLKSTYLFGANDLQFEIGMDLVSQPQREGPSADIPCEVVAQAAFLSWQSRSLGENLQVELLRTLRKRKQKKKTPNWPLPTFFPPLPIFSCCEKSSLLLCLVLEAAGSREFWGTLPKALLQECWLCRLPALEKGLEQLPAEVIHGD